MALSYGSPSSIKVKMLGPFGTVAGVSTKLTSITLPVSGWKGATSPYSQIVTVLGISLNSKVDLQASPELASDLQATAMMAVNDTGTVTVYAFGDKPAKTLTLQATITEVIA